jgi:hypothetical protein
MLNPLDEIGSRRTDLPKGRSVKPTHGAEVLEHQIDPTQSYFGYLRGLLNPMENRPGTLQIA